MMKPTVVFETELTFEPKWHLRVVFQGDHPADVHKKLSYTFEVGTSVDAMGVQQWTNLEKFSSQYEMLEALLADLGKRAAERAITSHIDEQRGRR